MSEEDERGERRREGREKKKGRTNSDPTTVTQRL